MKIMRPSLSSILMALVVAGVVVASILFMSPPTAVPQSAPAQDFSADRAFVHVQRIAQHPRPAGSVANAQARAYLLNALQSLGLDAHVQEASALAAQPRGLLGGRIANVVGRLKGTASTGAIALIAHYDSVPAAPGAGDNATSVAALVETMRALKASAPLRNDVVVLLSDAEERNLLGARAFANQHPWAKDVRVALDFEGGGTGGISGLFRAGGGNGVLVTEWANAVPHAAGFSVAEEALKRTSSNTDMAVFRARGIPCLDFGFDGNRAAYHSGTDEVSRMDRGTIQDHGETALVLARRLGMMDLHAIGAPDHLFFSLPGIGFVPHYRSSLAFPLAVALAVLVVVLALVLWRRGLMTVARFFLALFIWVLAFAGAGAFGYTYPGVLDSVHGGWLPGGHTYLSEPYRAALGFVVTAMWLALYPLLRRRFNAHTLAVSGALVVAALSLLSARFVVGGSYIPVWPLLGLVLGILLLPASGDRVSPSAPRTLAVAVLALPILLIICPLFVLTRSMAATTGMVLAAATMIGLAALAPQVEIITEGRRYWPAAIVSLAAILSLNWGAIGTRYSDERPRGVNVIYAEDADARTAQWAAQAAFPGEAPIRAGDPATAWLTQYLGESWRPMAPATLVSPWSSSAATPDLPTEGTWPFVSRNVAPLGLTAPSASSISEVGTSSGRELRLHVTPATSGSHLSVWVQGPAVVDATVDGQRGVADNASDSRPRQERRAVTPWRVSFYNAPASGFDLVLACEGKTTATVVVLERTEGLPRAEQFTPRPANLTPGNHGDRTYVRRTYRF